VQDFGEALRSLRTAAGLSQADLAAATSYAKSHIGNVETGKRQPTTELADACDRVLGTSPLLVMLTTNGGSDMRRRALVSIIGTSLGAGFTFGPDTLAEVIRTALSRDTGDDLEQVVANFERRYFLEPTTVYGTDLLSELLILRQRVAERPDPRTLATTAVLSQLYGLWSGNQGKLTAAHGWYGTAAGLADRSGDNRVRADVRGRSVVRGVYEGWSLSHARREIETTLALSPTVTVGRLEAHAARVHIAGLTGAVDEGRQAVADMWRTAEALPEPDHPATHTARTALFDNFLECRAGTPASAERAHTRAVPLLAATPLWLADAKIYYGRALVTGGDVAGGVRLGLDAVSSYSGVNLRVHQVGVRDLLSVVPPGYASDELHALRAYASPQPGPWETLQ